MAGEASNFPLQYADDDFDEDMSMEYEKLLHLLSEDLDPLQVGLVLLIVGEQGFSFFFFLELKLEVWDFGETLATVAISSLGLKPV